MTTTFRLGVFKVNNFLFYLRISELNPCKMWYNTSSLLGKSQIIIWNFPNSELQETHFHVFFFLRCFIVLYLCFYILGWSRIEIIVDTCEWDSVPIKFKIHFLKSCWLCAPRRNIMSSILHVSFQRPLLLIVYKFLREHFNLTFYCSFNYCFVWF